MNKAKEQEIFNDAVAHCAKQGVASGAVRVNGTGENSYATFNCRYRDAEGNKCVIGARMPDELYQPRFDEGGYSAFSLPESVMIACGLFDTGFARSLQRLHDDAANWTEQERLEVPNCNDTEAALRGRGKLSREAVETFAKHYELDLPPGYEVTP
jgi:hypothetical protein